MKEEMKGSADALSTSTSIVYRRTVSWENPYDCCGRKCEDRLDRALDRLLVTRHPVARVMSDA